jgi:bacterioferritin
MVDKQTIIKALQEIVTTLSQQADGHELQSRAFKALGYNKLAEIYAEHAEEERGYVNQCADRIYVIGGFVTCGVKQEYPIFTNPLECVKYDLAVSVEGLGQLRNIMEVVKDDVTTFDLLKDYYKDEEEDLAWSERQIQMISVIGEENWVLLQI